MSSLEIDGMIYDVKEGSNVLSTCLSMGFDLPYFCWHPALGSVGACRQCSIIQYKDAEDQHGRLVMACMTPVVDKMRISLVATQAQQFRSQNIELMMTNHPHDCPVCEEGGECHLQDMTLMSGHTFRRYRGKKRTHNNQDLGPFINHEMNRCIACYRCVRFYGDYAGGTDLQVLGSHNNIYFGRYEDGELENEFSGNLVEVCPTGVFTDKTFSAHYARKWDLQTAPSVCVHCGLGCNTAPGERYGTLRRVINRYHGEINGYFLCDRGRFGYGFVNSPKRIRSPRIDDRTHISIESVVTEIRNVLQSSEACIGIGSPRASLEANFALRTLVGEENFYLGLEPTEHKLLDTIVQIIRDGGLSTPSLKEIELADAILILGEDVTQTAPRMALSLRQSVRNASFELGKTLQIPDWQDAAIRQLPAAARSPIFIASVCATRLDEIASATYRGSPDDIARLGYAVANALDASFPTPDNLDSQVEQLATSIAERLKQAKRPLIISGCSCLNLAVVQAAFNVAKSLANNGKQLAFTVPECNSLGLAIMGGQYLEQAFTRVNNNPDCAVVILENNLYRRGRTQSINQLMGSAKEVIVLDSLHHETVAKAGFVLPSATFAESEGTLINNEGRAQRYFPVFPAMPPVQASWQWLTSVMKNPVWQHHDDITEACAAAFPDLAPISQAVLGREYERQGKKIPRQPHRYSGRTAMHANIHVSESASPLDAETPYAFSMEHEFASVAPAMQPVIWAPGWNSNQAINKFQKEIAGNLRGGDTGIRLFEAAAGSLNRFSGIPPTYQPESGIWLVVALPHIFGSEELSLSSPPIVERMPAIFVRLNPQDGKVLDVDNGDLIAIKHVTSEFCLDMPVLIEPSLPSGLIGITMGLPEFQGINTRDRVAVTKLTGIKPL